MNVFRYLRSLFARPSPPPPIPVEPIVHTDADGSYYPSRSGRRLHFSGELQRNLCYRIATTNKYPPRGVVGVLVDGEFGLYDRTTGAIVVVEGESKAAFKRAIRDIYRARREAELCRD